MIARALAHRLRRFVREEDGNATFEFAFYFSILFVILAASIEIAHLNLRHAMLERAVDLSVRELRLGTGTPPDYDALRTEICTRAAVVATCEQNLRLEMQVSDPRAFAPLPEALDCQNAAEDPKPVRAFVHGQQNQLMLLRACLKFKPILPSTALGAALDKDLQGYGVVVVTSAFVQEPG